MCSYRGPPGWLWCSSSRLHSPRCRHMSLNPLALLFQCTNCHHSSGKSFYSAVPVREEGNSCWTEHGGNLLDVWIWKLNTSKSYRFSILGPVSFWKRYSIQQHARNAEGLATAGGDDWGTLGQERGLCRKRKCQDIIAKQEQEKVCI